MNQKVSSKNTASEKLVNDIRRKIWKLCRTMKASALTDTLELALKASGCDSAKVIHKPRLLSDNGSSYISEDLATWLDDKDMSHVRGKPYHPQKQGKIDDRILLENCFLLGELENQIGAFINHYNHNRYHENLNNFTPAGVYFGKYQSILEKGRNIKLKTLK